MSQQVSGNYLYRGIEFRVETLELYIKAFEFYGSLIQERLKLLDESGIASKLLDQRTLSGSPLQQEYNNVLTNVEMLKTKIGKPDWVPIDGTSGLPEWRELNIQHKTIRYIKSVVELYLRYLRNERDILARDKQASDVELAPIDARIKNISEENNIGVFKDIELVDLLADVQTIGQETTTSTPKFAEEEEIILEQEQKDLLSTLVEISRNIPKNKRRKFILIQTKQRSWIEIPEKNRTLDVYIGDIEILANEGLLNLTYSSKGAPNFDVTPKGFKYYEYLKESISEPIQTIEISTRSYVASDKFQQEYPKAYQKWSEAEYILWSSDSAQQLTTIGHLCREAMQEFITRFVEKYKPQEIDTDKAHTVARAKAIISSISNKLGEVEKPFLEALIAS